MSLPLRRPPALLMPLGLVAVSLLFGGCIKLVRELPDAAPRETMAVYGGYSVPAAPPDPIFAGFTRVQAETSLQRLVVVRFGWSTFFEEPPAPLLSPDQVQRYSIVLARELPRLKPGERLTLAFRDRFRDYAVEVEIYPEGGFLVYAFRELMVNPDPSTRGPSGIRNTARMAELTGQTVVDRSHTDAVYLRDPVLPDVLNAAVARGERLALIEDALKRKVIAEDEAKRLRKALDTRAGLPLDVWKTFFNKRALLQKSYDERLMEASAFEQTRKRLEAELTGSQAPEVAAPAAARP